MGDLFSAPRIVFRHHKGTVDVFQDQSGSWYCSVQGEDGHRGPFPTPGRAVEEGITGAEKRAQVRAAEKAKKPNWKRKRKKTHAKIDRKYLRLE